MALTATTTRARILAAFERRLRGVSTIAGFATDAGRCVFVGDAPVLGEDDPSEVIAIVPADAEPLGDRTLRKVVTSWPIQVAALARMRDWQDMSRAWVQVEAVLGDIVRAIETEDRTLDGLVPTDLRRLAIRPLEREDGSLTIGAAITYDAPHQVAWGSL